MRRIFKFDNIPGNSLTRDKELNILVYEFSFASSHVGVNYKTIHFLADPLGTINFVPILCFVATFNSIVIYTGVVFIRHNKKTITHRVL